MYYIFNPDKWYHFAGKVPTTVSELLEWEDGGGRLSTRVETEAERNLVIGAACDECDTYLECLEGA